MSMDYWEKNGIKKPKSFIVCAACEFEGVIILGARHWDNRMHQQYDMMKNSDQWRQYAAVPSPPQFNEGFINQFGEFLNRQDAMIAAREFGQPIDVERGCGGSNRPKDKEAAAGADGGECEAAAAEA